MDRCCASKVRISSCATTTWLSSVTTQHHRYSGDRPISLRRRKSNQAWRVRVASLSQHGPVTQPRQVTAWPAAVVQHRRKSATLWQSSTRRFAARLAPASGRCYCFDLIHNFDPLRSSTFTPGIYDKGTRCSWCDHVPMCDQGTARMKALVRVLRTQATRLTKALAARLKTFAGSKWLAVFVLAMAALATAIVGYLFFGWANPPFPAAPDNNGTMDHGIVLLVSDPQSGEVTFDVSVNVIKGKYQITADTANLGPPSAFLALETETGGASAYSSGDYVKSVYGGNTILANGQDGELLYIGPPFKAPTFEIWGMDYGGYTSSAGALVGPSNISYGGRTAPSPAEGQLTESLDSSSGSVITGNLPPIEAWGYATENGSGVGSQVMHLRRFTSVKFNESIGPTGMKPQTTWYVPQKAVVDINVIYDPSGMSALPSRYRIDSANPPTGNSAELYWTLNDAASISWTLADLEGQRAATNDLFIAGILLGATFGFLGAAIEHSLPQANERRRRRPKA